MQDAIIKGIGNSRYLKTVGEALSLYPTYEDFLQAMIEGTFPVDFNGINKDGWTQQGTPLNKANLLSDTVISTLGLSTGVNSTPNDAFNVLANIGNVHVWRKTVTTEEEIPAGYKLGATITKATIFRGATSSYYFAAKAHATISVLDDGTPVVSGSNSGGQMGTISSVIADDGEFIYLEEISSSNGGNNLLIKPWLVKSVGGRSSLQFDVNTGNIECTGSFAQVTTYPTTPPGTHVTYLTSTNRNAYQDGDDEVPAKYMLGDIHSGDSVLVEWGWVKYKYSNEVKVSGDSLVLVSPSTITIHAGPNPVDPSEAAEVLPGKYIEIEDGGSGGDLGFEEHTIYFIPTDAEITTAPADTGAGAAGSMVITKKYQDVLLIPAIPAGTTIEYLGVLGDKTSIETGSYVGTGTYGSGNPNTLTFRFEPKFVHIQAGNIGKEDSSGFKFAFFVLGTKGFSIGPGSANELYNLNAKFDGNTLSWYLGNAAQQLNTKNANYFFIALG